MVQINKNQTKQVIPVFGRVKLIVINGSFIELTVNEVNVNTLQETGNSCTYKINTFAYEQGTNQWVGTAFGAYLYTNSTVNTSVVDLKKLEGELVILFEHYYFSERKQEWFVNVTDVFPVSYLKAHSVGDNDNEK